MWPNLEIGLMGLWLEYKPSFNPIGQGAVEIQPHFQSERSRGLVDMAKPRHLVNGVMAVYKPSFNPISQGAIEI